MGSNCEECVVLASDQAGWKDICLLTVRFPRTTLLCSPGRAKQMPQPLLHATARHWIMVSRTWVKTQTWDAEATWSWGRDQVGQWQPLLALTQAAEAAQTSDGSLAAAFPMTAMLCAPQPKPCKYPGLTHSTPHLQHWIWSNDVQRNMQLWVVPSAEHWTSVGSQTPLASVLPSFGAKAPGWVEGKTNS